MSLDDFLEQAQTDFTLHQVAELLHLGYTQTRNLRRRGAFPNAYKLGPSNRAGWRIPAKDVRKYVADNRIPQPTTDPETDQ